MSTIKRDYQKLCSKVSLFLHDIAKRNIYNDLFSDQLVNDIKNFSDNFTDLGMLINHSMTDEDYLIGHAVNVSIFSYKIACELSMNSSEKNILILSGLLHDIGRLTSDQEIYNKPRKLTKEEFNIVKKHPLNTLNMLYPIESIHRMVPVTCLLHHERLDGSGYPLGKDANDLNIYARILAICDVFDAMTCDRSYRTHQTINKAFGEMYIKERNRLDSELVSKFSKLFKSVHLI